MQHFFNEKKWQNPSKITMSLTLAKSRNRNYYKL